MDYKCSTQKNGNSFSVKTEYREAISKSLKQLIAHFSVSIDRSQQYYRSPGFVGGKFSKNCFLIPCRNCGEHFLASQDYVYSVIKGGCKLWCPHCHATNFSIFEINKMGHFKRKPIILSQLEDKKPRVLSYQEIHELLALDELPAKIKLVAFENEKRLCCMALKAFVG
jgi:phage FluMu protein Com